MQGQRSYGGWGAYAQSKLANILFTYDLARRLEGRGVTANCLHPGIVVTGFGQNSTQGLAGGLFRLFHTLGRPFLLTPEKEH